jgi:tetratricopeptide (TPR) repeat protein
MIANEAFAQPGDENGEHRLRQFQIVQDALATYPNDCLYRWASLELLFSPRFDLFTSPEESLADYFYKYHSYYPDSVDIYVHQPCDMCPSKRLTIPNPNKTVDSIFLLETDFLAEIDQLIDQDCDLEKRMMLNVGMYDHEANKASFLYKKGQYYYLTGEPEKALNNYVAALENAPSTDIKEEICLSIAAYYYNLNTPDTLARHRLALKYIDLVTPQQYDTIPRVIEKYGSHNGDRFELEKIRLLKSINDSSRLVNYLQNLSASHFAFYLKLLNDTPQDKWTTFYIVETLRIAHDYEQRIYQYLKETNTRQDENSFRLQLKQIMDRL